MKKITLFIGLFIVLFACTLTKEIPENDLSIEEFGGPAIDSTALYDEDLDYGDFEFDEEPKVRGIYNSSRTLYTDLIHTKLEVNFNWAKSQLNGVATITAKPHFHSSDSIVLDAKGMDIKKIEMNGKVLNYVYKDSLKLYIKLDRSYSRDEKFTLQIDYVSKPDERTLNGSAAITSDKGLFFINPKGEDKSKMPQIWTQGETESNSVWFPTIDAPNSKTSQEIFMTVDEKYLTLSNGKLISSKKNSNGTRTDHWKQDLPHAPYLFMMAVGEFKVVQDFYTRLDGSKMEVNYIVEPQFEKDAKGIFGETPAMIKFFSQKLGIDYPWDKYTQIVVRDYVSGAMENTGAVIFGEYVYKNERELLDDNDQSTIAHELFHHWFGDLVTCESWANLPLNESFANYSQYLWDEFRYGKDEADFQGLNESESYFNSAWKNYHNLIWFEYPDKENMFDGHSYAKGGRILHMLRNYLGDEGFFKGLNNYLTSNKFKTAEFHNLRMAFEEVSGEDLNWFFDQWFLGKGHPIIHTSQIINSENNTVTISIKQKQNIDDFPIYKLPVNIAIWDQNGKHIEKIVVENLEQDFTFSYVGELKNVLFDEQQMLLGKYYEDKPNKQFIHQYYNSSYRARATAIERAQRIKNSDSEKMIFDALNDPFWNIRVLAIEAYNKVKNELDNQATIQIKKLAREDPKPQVRSAALTYLASLPKEEASELMKFVLINEKSYNVISTALVTLKKINPESALISARDLQKEENTTLNTSIARVLQELGTEEDFAFFNKNLTNNSLKGYDEFNVFIPYVVWVLRMGIDLQEKSLAIFSQLKEKGGSAVQMYFGQVVDYSNSVYQGNIDALNAEISELEEAKSFGIVFEKKRLKQRYEDLIVNLTMLSPPRSLD
jgi:aminopeptidase N